MTAYADIPPLLSCLNDAGTDGYLEKLWDTADVHKLVQHSHKRRFQVIRRQNRRALATSERLSATLKGRERDLVQICGALGFEQRVCATFIKVLELV